MIPRSIIQWLLRLHVLNKLYSCLNDIKSWMACYFLQLNDSKTEVIIFGPRSSVTSLSSTLGPLSNNMHSVVRVIANLKSF